MAKYSGAKELFAELAEEEEKHRKLLEHVSVGKVFQGKLDPIPDLSISDYLIDVQCQPVIDSRNRKHSYLSSLLKGNPKEKRRIYFASLT